MSKFDELLVDLEKLHSNQLLKSAPAADVAAVGEPKKDDDDENIEAAAQQTEDAGAAEDDIENIDDDTEDEELGKSFSFTLENGETVEAVDGTEMVKALSLKLETQSETMAKALGTAVDLIKHQGGVIDALTARVDSIASSGRGRKAVVSIAEKSEAEMHKSDEPAGMSGEAFMTKALSAQKAGHITAHQVSLAEGYLSKGLAVPAELVQKVLN